MLSRIKDFCSKLLFCLKVSGSARSLYYLILNSKQFSRFYKTGMHSGPVKPETAVSYSLNLAGQKRNLYLRTFSGDIEIFYEVFWRQVYYIPELKWKDFSCILDIGANVGMAALYFKSLSPESRIIAIEPDPDNFSLLQRNAEGVDHLVHCIQAAVSNTNGFLSLEKSALAFNSKVTDSENVIKVKSINLDTLFYDLAIAKVDLVKIDIEGFEHRLFEGDAEWLNKVENLVIEIHSEDNYKAFSRKVVAAGFNIKKLSCTKDAEGIYLASKVLSFNKDKGQGKQFQR